MAALFLWLSMDPFCLLLDIRFFFSSLSASCTKKRNRRVLRSDVSRGVWLALVSVVVCLMVRNWEKG